MVGAWQRMSQRLLLDVEGYQKSARIDLTHLNAPVLGPRDRASGLQITLRLLGAATRMALECCRNVEPRRRQSALFGWHRYRLEGL